MKNSLFRYGGLILIGYAVVRACLLLNQDAGMTEGELGQFVGFLIFGVVGLGLFLRSRR